MKVITVLKESHTAVIDRAAHRLCECQFEDKSYATPEQIRETIEALFTLTLASVEARDAGPMIAWGQNAAQERFSAGCCLHEMQAVINTLESALWQTILEKLEPEAFAEAIGFVSTALGMAKDALAREWVTLATKRHAHSLDMKALFSGTSTSTTSESIDD